MSKLTAAAVARALRVGGKHSDGHGLTLDVVEPGRGYWAYRYQRDGASAS